VHVLLTETSAIFVSINFDTSGIPPYIKPTY
jgi:hypothetical protein